jgi:hypothetical protein
MDSLQLIDEEGVTSTTAARRGDRSSSASADASNIAIGEDSPPIFILSPARSGSTLLRYLLDTHPNIAAPPETFIAPALANLLSTHTTLTGYHTPGCDPEIREILASTAKKLFGQYASRQGKSRWCDKSLTSIDFAELLVDIFPDARFITLYRECTDVIMSAIEACKWGFNGYGFEPYVAHHPGNFVIAMGEYWADRVELSLTFERNHPERVARVLYEDLVSEPTLTLRRVLSFLDEPWSEQLSDPSLVFRDRALEGPGDYKITYTHAISTSSIGHGWQVPRTHLPDVLRERINRDLVELGYQLLESEVSPEDLEEPRTANAAGGNSPQRVQQGRVREIFFGRIIRRLEDPRYRPVTSVAEDSDRDQRRVIAVHFRDIGSTMSLDLTDRKVYEGLKEYTLSVVTDTQTIIDIDEGHLNVGSAQRSGRIGLTSHQGASREINYLLHDFLRLLDPDAL